MAAILSRPQCVKSTTRVCILERNKTYFMTGVGISIDDVKENCESKQRKISAVKYWENGILTLKSIEAVLCEDYDGDYETKQKQMSIL